VNMPRGKLNVVKAQKGKSPGPPMRMIAFRVAVEIGDALRVASEETRRSQTVIVDQALRTRLKRWL